MKTLNITFEDEEYQLLIKKRGNKFKSWEEFVITLARRYKQK